MAHISITSIADIHQALTDSTRVLILRLLLERELCVCEIVAALEEPQYKISRHLTVLKNAGLVRDRREGIWMHYDISPALTPEWRAVLTSLRAVWDQTTEVQAALWRLQQCTSRPPAASACCK